jgi:hypothetical protein
MTIKDLTPRWIGVTMPALNEGRRMRPVSLATDGAP